MQLPFRYTGAIHREALFWRIQAVGWSATALVSVGFVFHIPVWAALLIGGFRGLFGFLVTSFMLRPLLAWLRKRGSSFWWGHLVLVFLLCGMLGLVDAQVTTFFASAIGLDFGRPGVREFLSVSFPIRWALYVMWCVLYFAVVYWLETQLERLRAAERQAALHATELRMLRAQVNPHFLFNALNSLLAESSNAAAVQRITLALANYLRFSLRHEHNTDLLGMELDALESYLSVEKMRFEDDLEYTIESDEASRQTAAPVALIQPLLENAIKYGQRSRIRPLKVGIRTEVQNQELLVQVSNSGEWCEQDTQVSTGIGLSNLRRRLDLLYPKRSSVKVETSVGEVCVCVRLLLAEESGQ